MKEKFDSLVEHFVANAFFLEEAVEMLEKGLICRVLEKTEGNRSEASKMLGIHRNTLQRKMIQYQIGNRHVRRKPPRRVGQARKKAAAG